MKKIVKYLKVYGILLTFFVLSLTLVALIPRRAIEKNVFESAKTLYKEGEYTTKNYLFKEIQNDNYADAVMINNAYSMDSTKPLYSALIVRRNYVPSINKSTLKEEVGDPVGNSKETTDLLKTVLKSQTEAKEYAKYWHGYLIYLKPLLIFFNYEQIRIIQLIVLVSLMYVLLYLIYEKIGLKEAIIFLVGFFIVNLELIYTCLEFWPVYIVMLSVSIFMLLKYEKMEDEGIIFFVSGILTCFFDFLTAPIVTLGVPLLIYFLLKQKKEELSIKDIIKIFMKNCFAWAIGYGTIWVTKFLLVDLLYNKNLLMSGFRQVKYRTTGKIYTTYLQLVTTIIESCNVWIFLLVFIVCFISLLFTPIIKIKRNKVFLYLLISCLPIAWYIVLKEHSILHAFFTHRSTLVLWLSLMLMINSILEDNEIVLFKSKK